MKIDLVLRDRDGDAWVRLGGSYYALAADVQRGAKYAELHRYHRTQLEEDYDPITVEYWEGQP